MAPVAGDWAKGWQVQDAGDNVLRERAALTSALSVVARPVAGVAFTPNGRMADDTADGNLEMVDQFDHQRRHAALRGRHPDRHRRDRSREVC